MPSVVKEVAEMVFELKRAFAKSLLETEPNLSAARKEYCAKIVDAQLMDLSKEAQRPYYVWAEHVVRTATSSMLSTTADIMERIPDELGDSRKVG